MEKNAVFSREIIHPPIERVKEKMEMNAVFSREISNRAQIAMHEKEVVHKIISILSSQKKTVEDLANGIGVGYVYLSNVLFGTNAFKTWHIVKIAKFLNVSADELLNVRLTACEQ